MTGFSPTKPLARPRVVHVTTAHWADDVRIFERECRSLAATDSYEVYLAARGTIPSDSGVNLIPLAPRPSRRAERFWSGPRTAFALSRSLAADIWHFHDPELLPVALRMSTSGHRVIWDAHEDYSEQFTSNGPKNWVPGPARGVVRRGMTALLRMVDDRASGVVAATATIASRYNNPRTVVVGNEAKLEVFEGCRPSFESRQVLFTGSPTAGHLFPQLVEAVAAVPDVRLAVAGREPAPQTWAWAEATLGPRLRHLGWLSRPRLALAMSESSLGALTYANTPSYAVAASTKLYEFAAGGLPVIASPNQMNVRALADSGAGFLAPDFTVAALAQSIAQGHASREAWESASSLGRTWALRVGSWSASEERLLGLYTEILGDGDSEERRRSQ